MYKSANAAHNKVQLSYKRVFEGTTHIVLVVSQAETLRSNLGNIARSWHQQEMTELFTETLGYRPDCLETTCPRTMHQPKSCHFDGQSQDAKFRFTRTRVRNDAQIAEANAFRYYNVSRLSQVTAHQYWLNKSTISVCWTDYEGPRFSAKTESGCLKRVTPAVPSAGDVPILLEDCIEAKRFRVKPMEGQKIWR